MTLAALRRAVSAREFGGLAPAADGGFGLGFPALDERLGSLARGALHEVYAQGVPDAAATTGFGLGLALRAVSRRPLVWVRQQMVDTQAGGLHGDGLAAFGLDPARLLVVRARDPTATLRVAAEVARCPAIGVALVEIWGMPRILDLTASRRLALAAGSSGVTIIMIRIDAAPCPSAATTRWRVAASVSMPLEANAPGRPAFSAALLRHRAGLASRTWRLEWDRDSLSFASPAATAPLSRPVVPVPADRSVAADGATPWRRAG